MLALALTRALEQFPLAPALALALTPIYSTQSREEPQVLLRRWLGSS